MQKALRDIEQRRYALDERDIVLGVVVEQGGSSLDGDAIPAQQAISIRHDYNIEKDQFAVILIGKDGGEKHRSFESLNLDSIFFLVDRMPMRKDEILVRG